MNYSDSLQLVGLAVFSERNLTFQRRWLHLGKYFTVKGTRLNTYESLIQNCVRRQNLPQGGAEEMLTGPLWALPMYVHPQRNHFWPHIFHFNVSTAKHKAPPNYSPATATSLNYCMTHLASEWSPQKWNIMSGRVGEESIMLMATKKSNLFEQTPSVHNWSHEVTFFISSFFSKLVLPTALSHCGGN